MASASSGEDEPADSSSLRRLIITTLIAVLLGAGEEIFDPFGLDSESDRLSANIFNSISSPFYGARTVVDLDDQQHASRFGQSNIVVLLLDDSYLEATGRQWPLDPRDYRRILRKLVDADAAAVFVDIFFIQDNEQRRERIAALYRESACLAASSACPAVDDDWNCNDLPERAPCSEPAADSGTAIVFAGTLQSPVPTALGIRPADTALAAMLSGENIYRLTQTAVDGELYDTAAWALYKAWCRRNAACDAAAIEGFSGAPMYLHWGYAPNHMLTDVPAFGGSVCRRQAETFIGRFYQSVRIFGWNLVRGFHDARIAPCPYHTQVKLQLFNNLSADDLQQLVAGKVVLIGASLANFPDWKWSPVHDYIPGVFWHAMALDNLMEFGPNYRKDPEEKLSDNFEALGIAGILILHAFITWLIRRRTGRLSVASEKELEQSREEAALRLDLIHGLLTVTVISATVLFITGLRSWSPANWIGFAMLMLLIDFKPVTSLGRFCWRIYPIARLNRLKFRYWLYNLFAAMTLVLILLATFLLFILPHALLLGRAVDDTLGSYFFLVVYAAIIGSCFALIWRETSS